MERKALDLFPKCHHWKQIFVDLLETKFVSRAAKTEDLQHDYKLPLDHFVVVIAQYYFPPPTRLGLQFYKSGEEVKSLLTNPCHYWAKLLNFPVKRSEEGEETRTAICEFYLLHCFTTVKSFGRSLVPQHY